MGLRDNTIFLCAGLSCVSVIHTDSEIRTISDLNIIISAMIVENHLWAGYLYSSVCVVSKFSHSHYYIVSLL